MDPQDPKPTSQFDAAAGPTLGRHFDHHRLDAWRVALEALIEGDSICKKLPRGHGKLRDQLQRALQGAFTLTSEAAARTGADRACRFRWARAEAGEAAAILEAVARMGLADAERCQRVIALLWRQSAMLTRLALRGT